MKYLLDTNAVSFAIRGVGNVGKKILQQKPDDLAVSSVTEAELWYGVRKRKSKKLENLVNDFLAPMNKLDFCSEEALVFGKLFSDLEKKGNTIGMADTMIASIAICNELVLVTDNVKHFKRIKGLKVENWT
jgi:tRNA(fMet)-specific endonuclease VapC